MVTGAGGQAGQVTFALSGWAEVTLVADAEGGVIRSDMALVSGYPGAVAYEKLKRGLYCGDDTGCTELVQSGVCGGKLSWNVVFVRSY